MGTLVENITAVRVTAKVTNEDDPHYVWGACYKVLDLKDLPETITRWAAQGRVITGCQSWPATMTTYGSGKQEITTR